MKSNMLSVMLDFSMLPMAMRRKSRRIKHIEGVIKNAYGSGAWPQTAWFVAMESFSMSIMRPPLYQFFVCHGTDAVGVG